MASSNHVVSFLIRAKDGATKTLHSIGSAITSLGSALLRNGANIQAWGQMIGSAVAKVQGVFGTLWGAIKESFKFETLTVQFKTLLGSMDAARERMAMLAKFAETTPFEMEEVARASRTLTVMSGDALGSAWALRTVGDAAAATGANIEELSMWIGRAYAMIQAGKPFGEAAMRLSELGVITPQVRAKMEELQAAGASSVDVWTTLTDHLATFDGAMLDLSRTGDGLTSTLSDNWTAAVRTFGDAFQKAAKESIQFLIDLLAKLQADGTIQRWAEAAVRALTPVKDLITAVLGGQESRGQALTAAWDYLKAVFAYGADAIKASADYFVAKLTGGWGKGLTGGTLTALATPARWSQYGINWLEAKIRGVDDATLARWNKNAERKWTGANMLERAGWQDDNANKAFSETMEKARQRLGAAATAFVDGVSKAAETAKESVVQKSKEDLPKEVINAIMTEGLGAEKEEGKAKAISGLTNAKPKENITVEPMEEREKARKKAQQAEWKRLQNNWEEEANKDQAKARAKLARAIERETSAKAREQELRRRADDNRYREQVEKEEKDAAKREDYLNRKRERTLQDMADSMSGFTDEERKRRLMNMSEKELTERFGRPQRAALEWKKAQLEAQKAVDTRTRAEKALDDANNHLAQIRRLLEEDLKF